MAIRIAGMVCSDMPAKLQERVGFGCENLPINRRRLESLSEFVRGAGDFGKAISGRGILELPRNDDQRVLVLSIDGFGYAGNAGPEFAQKKTKKFCRIQAFIKLTFERRKR